jgi:hypothetical protein
VDIPAPEEVVLYEESLSDTAINFPAVQLNALFKEHVFIIVTVAFVF